MNGCTRASSTCNGRDVKLVKLFLRRESRPVCAGCREAMERLGMAFTVESPDTRPAWLRRDVSRDETGLVA